MKLLLVEDNDPVAQSIANIVQLAIEDAVVDVTIAPSAADAVVLTAKFDFDVILMDLGLTRTPMMFVEGRLDTLDPTPPGFDGGMTALAIRGFGWRYPGDPVLSRRASVPIVAVTGGHKELDPKLEELAGFAAVLNKPVMVEQMRNVIMQYVRKEGE